MKSYLSSLIDRYGGGAVETIKQAVLDELVARIEQRDKQHDNNEDDHHIDYAAYCIECDQRTDRDIIEEMRVQS